MALVCGISGEVPEEPVLSPISGTVFEKRLIEKHLIDNPTDPTNGESLSVDQLISIATNKIVQPRPPNGTSIPALIKLFQDEWDGTMLETFKLREHVTQIRQELAHALYQHDAACRVIARLTRERDQARQALATLQPTSAPTPVEPAAGDKMEVDAEDDGADDGMTPEVVEKLLKASKVLSKGRRKKKEKSEELATVDDIKNYSEKASQVGLHSASTPGITCVSIGDLSGTRVLTGGVDKNATLLDTTTNKSISFKGHKKKVTSVILHPTADVAVTASLDKTICIWDASSGDKKHTVKTHTADVTGISLHPTGDYFISSSEDKHYGFSSIETGQTLAYGTDAGVTSGFNCCQFHPDGLFFGMGHGSVVDIWDIKDQSKATTFEGHTGKVTSLAFSENGYYLATSSEDSTVKLWDLRKLKNIKTLEFESGFNASSLCFDHSGSYLAVGGNDIRVFNTTKEWSHLKTLTNHSKTVTGVAFQQHASQLYSVSMDRSLKTFGFK
eukprot:m.82489 g.82489  ORF g.82489 m.82489 type:complete len:500 (+) comp25520_c2_seq1:203-1702(+)